MRGSENKFLMIFTTILVAIEFWDFGLPGKSTGHSVATEIETQKTHVHHMQPDTVKKGRCVAYRLKFRKGNDRKLIFCY